MNNQRLAKALRLAATIVEKLIKLGVDVRSVSWDGDRPILIVEREPAFVTGALIRRHPLENCIESVYASAYQGCRLQWVVRNPITQGVSHAHH